MQVASQAIKRPALRATPQTQKDTRNTQSQQAAHSRQGQLHNAKPPIQPPTEASIDFMQIRCWAPAYRIVWIVFMQFRQEGVAQRAAKALATCNARQHSSTHLRRGNTIPQMPHQVFTTQCLRQTTAVAAAVAVMHIEYAGMPADDLKRDYATSIRRATRSAIIIALLAGADTAAALLGGQPRDCLAPNVPMSERVMLRSA